MERLNYINFFFIILFFILIRFIDASPVFNGVLFILISHTLIFYKQKKLTKSYISLLIIFFSFFIFINEKKQIIEISAPLKLSENTKNKYIYENILNEYELNFITPYFLEVLNNCYIEINDCFEKYENEYSMGYSRKNFDISISRSPDQILFLSDSNISRKINKIEFSSLANSRNGFINYFSGNINRHNIYKLETPYFIKFKNLNSIDTLCFKGLIILKNKDLERFSYNAKKNTCIDNDYIEVIGFNLPEYNLEIFSSINNYKRYIDEFFLIVFLLIVISNITKNNFLNNLKFFIPSLISIFIIFYISSFDSWFSVFNLFSFYFFGFEGGDGLGYINFASDLFKNFNDLNLNEFFRAGEDIFYFTPGLRFIIFLNYLISGNFYHFYFFILFFLPKVIYEFLLIFFNKKISYFLLLSFLLLPLLHHIGFSYYQFIRHAYRLYPEPLGYLFFISGLILFIKSFKKDFLKMNFLFAISVFLRPNLILSIFLIVLIKTIIEKVNIFKFKNFIILFLISLFYLFPLIHNFYFGNSLILFTSYGSNILSFENILSKDFYFYQERLLSLNSVLLFLIFIPNLNPYFKVILITQYITIFFFDLNGRYYWIFWIISLTMFLNLIFKYFYKWPFLKKYILK